jgi:hypothetical protein
MEKGGCVMKKWYLLLSKGNLVWKHLLVRQEKKEATKMNKRVTLMALLLSISLISHVSAVTGTYVDLTPFNTVAVDGADPWYNADGSGGLWRQRAFGNEDSIYQGQGANGGDLRTTISDLIPGQVYDIYAIYWSKSIGENWGILPGLDPNRAYATWYDWENGTETGPIILESIYEMEALVGTATANKEGEVGIYVFNHAHITTSHRSWVDGFSYKQAFLTYNPQPSHQEESVALDTNQLAWSTMLDPSNPTQTHPEVAEHWVYFGETPYLTLDHLLAKVPVSTEQVSFKTIPSFDPPLGSQPQDVRTTEGETITFTAVAGTTGGPVENCQWYKGLPGDTSSPLSDDPNHISGAQSNQLTIIVASADEGSYFCRAANDGGAKDSEAATLLLKRLLAWYKFDENLNNSAGDNSGTMDNPVYVDGMDGKALSFDGSNYVNLGTGGFPKTGFNNGMKSGAISFWINSPVPGHSFTATFNDDSATGFKVDYTIGNSLSFLIRDDNGVGLSRGIAPSGSILDAWHLITCTWDTESGEAAIYLDGVSTGLATSGQPSEFAAWQYPMLIGARQNRLTVDDFYVGLMDDYRVYNYPLDGYEVAELYTSLAGGKICVEYPVGDLNQDCVVDQADLEILRSAWLDCGWVPATACEYKIDLADLVPLLTAWLDELEELGADEGI